MKKTYLLVLMVALALTSCKTGKHADLGDGVFADIQTNKGDIVVKLEHNKTPITVASFVSLAEGKTATPTTPPKSATLLSSRKQVT